MADLLSAPGRRSPDDNQVARQVDSHGKGGRGTQDGHVATAKGFLEESAIGRIETRVMEGGASPEAALQGGQIRLAGKAGQRRAGRGAVRARQLLGEFFRVFFGVAEHDARASVGKSPQSGEHVLAQALVEEVSVVAHGAAGLDVDAQRHRPVRLVEDVGLSGFHEGRELAQVRESGRDGDCCAGRSADNRAWIDKMKSKQWDGTVAR